MERQLTELIGGLLEDGFEVRVISRTCRVPPHPRLEWVRVRGPARPFPLAYPWFLIVGSALVRRRARGVVHSTGAIVLNRIGVITVHLCHHEIARIPELLRVARASRVYRLNGRLASWLSRLAERWCYRPGRVTRLVAVSGGVADELRRHFPELTGSVSIVPNGVDTTRFRPDAAVRAEDPASSLTALFVGGEWEGKGLRFVIEALSGLPSWRLAVVGRGDADRYRRLADSHGVADQVSFHGVSGDVASLYRRADAFVLPTAYESFSLVTYEAAASGLPLLVSRVSGVADLLEDSVSGWFVDRDAKDVRRRLLALQTDPGLRARMGAAARAASLEFSWDRMVAGYERVYAEV
jgi:glycosyltransferase involved in cell wall biosynthesis